MCFQGYIPLVSNGPNTDSCDTPLIIVWFYFSKLLSFLPVWLDQNRISRTKRHQLILSSFLHSGLQRSHLAHPVPGVPVPRFLGIPVFIWYWNRGTGLNLVPGFRYHFFRNAEQTHYDWKINETAELGKVSVVIFPARQCSVCSNVVKLQMRNKNVKWIDERPP